MKIIIRNYEIIRVLRERFGVDSEFELSFTEWAPIPEYPQEDEGIVKEVKINVDATDHQKIEFLKI